MGAAGTFLIGILGGILGALVTDFLRAPVRQFFTRRTEIRHQMLRLANVPPPDPKWTHPTYTEEAIARLMAPSREAHDTLRNLGTWMMAFAETETIATFCVTIMGYRPSDAGSGLIGLANSLAEYGSERAAHRKRVNEALKLPD